MYPSYREFCRAITSDQRKRAAGQVVIDYNNSPDSSFVVSLCASAERQSSRIHHDLWSGIVFPYVASRFNSDPVAVKCLVALPRNHDRLG